MGELAWTDTRIERSFETRLESPSALKRTLGGVGAGGRKAPGYPIWRLFVTSKRPAQRVVNELCQPLITLVIWVQKSGSNFFFY